MRRLPRYRRGSDQGPSDGTVGAYAVRRHWNGYLHGNILRWDQPLVNHPKLLTDQLFDELSDYFFGTFSENGGRYLKILHKTSGNLKQNSMNLSNPRIL